MADQFVTNPCSRKIHIMDPDESSWRASYACCNVRKDNVTVIKTWSLKYPRSLEDICLGCAGTARGRALLSKCNLPKTQTSLPLDLTPARIECRSITTLEITLPSITTVADIIRLCGILSNAAQSARDSDSLIRLAFTCPAGE